MKTQFKSGKYRFMDRLRIEAAKIVDKHGASAASQVRSCTPLEQAVIVELRSRKLSKIVRLK